MQGEKAPFETGVRVWEGHSLGGVEVPDECTPHSLVTHPRGCVTNTVCIGLGRRVRGDGRGHGDCGVPGAHPADACALLYGAHLGLCQGRLPRLPALLQGALLRA